MKKVKLILFISIFFFTGGNIAFADELEAGGNAFEERLISFNNSYKEKYVNKIFPVGTIYITVSDENPGVTIGGVWERYATGRTLVGVGNGYDGSTYKSFEVGNTGGSYTLVASSTSSGDFYLNSSNININGSKMASTFNNLAPYVTAYIWRRTS
jgi:hypothetical protein